MKKLLLINLILFLASHSVFSQHQILTGGWVFDTDTKTFKKNRAIYIVNGKFGTGNEKVLNWQVKSLSDNDYILPGLIDLHAHYRVSYDGKAYDDTLAMPKIFLANGITSTFPAGEIEPEKMWDLQKRIDAGQVPGPRILHSGPYFGTAAPDWNPDFTEQDIRKRVDEWAGKGAYGFKAKGITGEDLEVLIDQAHKHDLTVTGHLNSGFRNSVNPQEAIEMGIDRVEHFLGGRLFADSVDAYQSLKQIDPQDPLLDEIIQLYIENGVYFDATLATYGAIGMIDSPVLFDFAFEDLYFTPFTLEIIKSKKPSSFNELCALIYPVKQQILKRYYDAGGLITVGTDRPLLLDNYLGGGIGGFFIHKEMAAMVEVGIPAADVLYFATQQNAQALGVEDRTGSIKPGNWADLMIIKGNPLEDITRTRSVHTVIKGGKFYNSQDLKNSAKGKLGPEN
ncbi:amidohydrolase family protein [Algoriphagus zhangzhouensis]|uniref:Imidazolonepropionase n=1 Tax=Algoriphagus zhangzhouensis TaxID=1073327 RepID=A0A1M7ZHF1_9BACT|nr:amidohydrolase family protein [Algoriphagus zhangzhouensis]TDY44118.1 imidazolonepropionase-like amidohydrolase [Algoriphagus zhangzhouensis]SHO64249.1 Imidazolonepropionase [Algoriphagus zhangzhouensis]